jgi:hypothetical protein
MIGTEPPEDAGTWHGAAAAAAETLSSEPSWSSSIGDGEDHLKEGMPGLSRQGSIWKLSTAESVKMTPTSFRLDAAKERLATAGAGASVNEGMRACMLHLLAAQEVTREDDQVALRRCFQTLRGLPWSGGNGSPRV